jgi:hypothetical protein
LLPLMTVTSKHDLGRRLTTGTPLPRWIRAPRKGQEYWTGFSRSKLYELAKDGKIRSVSIREAGHEKGTRLFELRSILEFIDAQYNAAQKAA